MRQPSTNIVKSWLAVLVVFCGCSVDLGKLRAPKHNDAGPSTDSAIGVDTAGPDAQPTGGPDGGLSSVADAPTSTDGLLNSDGSGIFMGGDADPADGMVKEVGVDIALDRTDPAAGDTGADWAGLIAAEDAHHGPETNGSTIDSEAGNTDSGIEDVPSNGGLEVLDGRVITDQTTGDDMTDSRAADAAAAPSVDVRPEIACPATISGSLDPSDATQIGRHSRFAPASTCGTMKSFPGNAADTTYLHLYDAYQFSNPTGAAVCFNFTLSYIGSQQLYVAAYSAFDPTNIGTGYLGDVGGALYSPQSMGITVGAGATLDVVVYATATGTAAAGSYTLSCSTP